MKSDPMSERTRKVRPTASIDEFNDAASAYLGDVPPESYRRAVDSLDGSEDWGRDQWLEWLRPRGLIDDSLEGRVILYTNAVDDYDGFGTINLDGGAGHDNQGKTIRKVAVLAEHLEWQRNRYCSGLYASATPEEVTRFRAIWTLHNEETGK